MSWGDLTRILNRAPERPWPDGVIHHGARVMVLLLLAGVVSLLFPVTPLPDAPPVERGTVLEEDVIAEVPFPVYKSEEELERERRDAAASVNPIFVYDPTAVDSMLADVDRFFTRVDSAADVEDDDAARRRVRDLLSAYAIPPSSADIDLLMDPALRDRLRRTVRGVILDELPRGVAMSGDLEEAGSQRIRITGIEQERTVPPDSVWDNTDFYDRSRFHVPTTAPRGYEQLQRLILVRFMVASLQPDWETTERVRERSRAAVNPLKAEIQEGQRVVPAREPVTEADVERFRAYRQELERMGDAVEGRGGLRALGGFLFNLLLLGLFGVLLYFFRNEEVYRDLRHVGVITVLVLTLVAVAAVIATYDAPLVALIPIAFPALVVATLWDGRLALNLSLILAILLTGQTPFLGIVALLTLVAAGAVAALSVRVVRRRAQAWGFIALIAGAYLAVGLILGLLRGWAIEEMGVFVAWGAVNAVASAFAAMGFMPLFEGFTKITTDQTLLELADVNRPLLRRLSLEAPGTYAHSINVANLAEAAAGGIGANALLTRVGVYYHDVGKIVRPHYFIENQPSGRNPHDNLKPAKSAERVREHVLEGIRLAEEANLPECVKAFIREHHGTQSISFFYDQAREADPEAELDPDDFAYPGPRPQSKETAIVMLADSVESAARVLTDTTPEGITELVDRIVQVKIDAGQLGETPVTLEELSLIKAQFVNVLTGMYHQRIDYPPSKETEAEGERPPGHTEGVRRDVPAEAV
ncbi:MAG: HDIG domain-containing protein [Longimicrobiales bacterium]